MNLIDRIGIFNLFNVFLNVNIVFFIFIFKINMEMIYVIKIVVLVVDNILNFKIVL